MLTSFQNHQNSTLEYSYFIYVAKLVKSECDSKNLTGIFVRSYFFLTEPQQSPPRLPVYHYYMYTTNRNVWLYGDQWLQFITTKTKQLSRI